MTNSPVWMLSGHSHYILGRMHHATCEDCKEGCKPSYNELLPHPLPPACFAQGKKLREYLGQWEATPGSSGTSQSRLLECISTLSRFDMYLYICFTYMHVHIHIHMYA